VNIKNNKLDIEYSYPTTGVYVQNIEGIEHCFVTIIIVNKSDLPKDLQNVKIYKKN